MMNFNKEFCFPITLMAHSASFLDPGPAQALTLVANSLKVFKTAAWLISSETRRSEKLGDWFECPKRKSKTTSKYKHNPYK